MSPTGLTRTNTYTSYNMLTHMSVSNGNSLNFLHDSGHQRVREIRVVGGVTTTLYSMHPDNQGGLLYEKEVVSTGQVRHKHYVTGGSGVAAMVVLGSETRTEYWHKDHLGSIAAVTDEAGTVTSRRQYDPWGQEVTPAGGDGYRGFTGHAQYDVQNGGFGVIHMNGRVYDPAIGRFLSADPIIQDADNLQNYNRYGYCMGNPLICTDPSGYKFKFGKIFKIAAIIAASIFLGPEILAAYTASVGGASAFGVSVVTASGGLGVSLSATGIISSGAIGGFAAGVIGEGTLEGGLRGALSGALFGAAAGVQGADSFERALAHAGAGCVQGALGGGGCGRGAASAFAAKFIGENSMKFDNKVLEGVRTAVIGGTASVIGGGKFENGAVTAAFGYLFNQMSEAARARLIAAGGFLGGTAGWVAGGACTAASGGICALGAPGIAAGGAALGMLTGDALATGIDKLTEHGNSWLSPTPTTVYALVSNADPTIVLKFGITGENDPTKRYSPADYAIWNATMVSIATFENRAMARMTEFSLCAGYVASTGRLPPLSGRC